MDRLEGTTCSVLPNWGSGGMGRWILAKHQLRRRPHPRPGRGIVWLGTVVNGDTTTRWFRSQDTCFEAITADAFFHWTCPSRT